MFDARCTAETVTLVGAVSLEKGYPISGEYGEDAAKVTVELENGESEFFMLRNGIDITTVFTTLGSSVIDPVAVNAKPLACFGYDKNFENYSIKTLRLSLSEKNEIRRIRIESSGNGYGLLVYGIYI